MIVQAPTELSKDMPRPWVFLAGSIEMGKAVDWQNGDKTKPPIHNYNDCIRCYCCQEMCPEGAIFIDRPFLGKIFSRI